MQAGVFMAVLFTTAYAPHALLTGWLHTVATYNPVRTSSRRCGRGSWETSPGPTTWKGLVSLAGLTLVVVAFALRGLRRASD